MVRTTILGRYLPHVFTNLVLSLTLSGCQIAYVGLYFLDAVIGTRGHGCPQLYQAALDANIVEVEEALSGINYPAPDVNARCQTGNALCRNRTPLELALIGPNNRERRIALVSLLVKKGARADTVDLYRKTPLHYAVDYYSLNSEMFVILIAAGGEVNARDPQGLTTLAQLYRQKATAEHLYKKEIDYSKTTKVLVDAGAIE